MLRGVWIVNSTPERIPGGRASNKPPISIDPWQIQRGVQVELEHTRDPRIAYEIAVDHLYEIPDYYTRLDQMERAAGLGRISLRNQAALAGGVLALIGAVVAIGVAFIEREAA